MKDPWRTFYRACRITGVLLSAVACVFLWGLWKTTRLHPVVAGQPVAIDGISLQIDILSLTLAAVGIGLGAIGLFGYQSIKDAAEARAERIAREVAGARADEVATRAVAAHMENMRDISGLKGERQAATVAQENVMQVDEAEADDGRNSGG